MLVDLPMPPMPRSSILVRNPSTHSQITFWDLDSFILTFCWFTYSTSTGCSFCETLERVGWDASDGLGGCEELGKTWINRRTRWSCERECGTYQHDMTSWYVDYSIPIGERMRILSCEADLECFFLGSKVWRATYVRRKEIPSSKVWKSVERTWTPSTERNLMESWNSWMMSILESCWWIERKSRLRTALSE